MSFYLLLLARLLKVNSGDVHDLYWFTLATHAGLQWLAGPVGCQMTIKNGLGNYQSNPKPANTL